MACDPFKRFQQRVIARICDLIDGLAANSSIHMDDGGNTSTRLVGCLQSHDHEGGGHWTSEILARGFDCETWTKRPPVLAEFDRCIDPITRLGFARIGKNRP